MAKNAVIKVLNEIEIAIIGLNVQEYKMFYDMFGLLDEGYFFKPGYQLGTWDGKIRMFSETGVTSKHNLPLILKQLKRLGYSVSVKDNRRPVTWDLPNIDIDSFKEFGVQLGNHQAEAINALLDNCGGITLAATGAGKSYITGALIKHIHDHTNFTTLVIVPTTDLVTQTADEVKVFGNDVGEYHGKKKQLDKTHLVSTWQSLQHTPEIISNYQCVIVDEAHGTKSNVLKSLLIKYAKNAVFIAGVTGTLPKHEAPLAQIKYVLGEQVSVVEGHHLMDLGWLAQLSIRGVILEENFKEKWNIWKAESTDNVLKYSQFKNTYFPDYASEKSYLQKNKRRLSEISQVVQEATKRKGNSFILVNGVDFGRRLAKLIPNAIFIDGKDSSEVRTSIYKQFADNDNMIVIATFSLASTGLNIKRIFNLFMIDSGKSFIQVIQSIGRGLRKAADKQSVDVYDICSDLKYARSHVTQRTKYYDEKKYNFKFIKIDYSTYINWEELLNEFDKDSLDNHDDIVVY